MDEVRPGFPFRLILPMVQLIACLAVLWPYWPSLRAELWRDIHAFEQSLLNGGEAQPAEVVIDVTPPATPPAGTNDYAMRMAAPAALNLPAGLIQLPYMLANPARTEWVPEGMWYREWRAISWPFLGLVFWWMAGRGLEALSAARRHLIRPNLHAIEVVVGGLLFFGGAMVCIALGLDRNPTGIPADPMFAFGGALWSILGLVIVTARLLQWGLRRMARARGLA